MDENNLQNTWTNFKEGDKESFAFFYNLHLDKLYQYGKKICSDEEIIKDAIQETYIDLYLKREKINTTPEKLKYYLLLSLKRNLIKKLVYNRRFYRGDKTIRNTNSLEFSIEYEIIEKEKDEALRLEVIEALSCLPGKQKEAIYLRFNEALDYSEIAIIMGITVESVRKQVYRALNTVRKLVEDKVINILFYFFSKKREKRCP